MTKFIRQNPRILYILLWFIVMVIHFLLLRIAYLWPTGIALTESIVFNTLFALFGSGLWYMVRFSNLKSRSIPELIINHAAGSIFTVGLWLAIGMFLLNYFFRNNIQYTEQLQLTMVPRTIIGFFFYAVTVSIYYLIISFRELNEKMLREAELSNMLREAELSMLRSQMRPHFLFNALNSISSLTLSDPQKAQDMVIKLSEFMRYAISHTEEKLIPLEQEIYHINLYLEIEKIRFGRNLVVNYEIPEQCKALPVPALILQPLIENCIKYGLYESTGIIEIKVAASCSDELGSITIINNYDPDSAPKKGTGTGLKNVRKRLEKLYFSNNLMEIQEKAGYFEVEIKIPRHAQN